MRICDGVSSTMLRVYSPLWSKSFNICTSTFVRHAEELASRSYELRGGIDFVGSAVDFAGSAVDFAWSAVGDEAL